MGHEHVVVAPGPRDGAELLEEVRSTPNRVNGAGRKAPRLLSVAGPSLPYDSTYHLLWRVDKVRALVTREAPDVLEIHSPYAAAAACLSLGPRSYRVRTFVWHSDFIDTYLRVMVERVGMKTGTVTSLLEPLWGWARFIASRCDATVVASRFVEDKLASHGVPRLVRLPFGVDRVCFSPAARSEAVRRELLGGGEDVPLLLGVGRFAVEKQWDVVLDAFEVVHAETPCVLVLVGDGPERSAIEARAKRLGGHLRVLGFEADRERLAAVLASADLLVHGCPYETFGFAVAEALSSGLPVVVPDAGGAGELVNDTCSERFAAGDAEACARAVRRMLARLRTGGRAALGARALKATERLPTVREHLEGLYEVYERLLRDRGAEGSRGLSFRL
jgi:alpha-1,6-mannosyltransferase